MFRMMIVFVFVATTLLLATATGTAEAPKIALGKEVEGELKKGDAIGGGYGTDIQIELKAGQSLFLSATVVGQGREVCLHVIDPTNKVIATAGFKAKTVQHTVEEVSATGTYKIRVASRHVGAFTLRTGSSAKELDVAAIKARIKALKEELADQEKKLEALESTRTLKGVEKK